MRPTMSEAARGVNMIARTNTRRRGMVAGALPRH